MKYSDLEAVADLILAVGHAFDKQEGRVHAHREVLGEVFDEVIAAINRELAHAAIDSEAAFVCSVARRGFSRAYWRDRKQAAKRTPTQEDAILESGIAFDLLGRSFLRSPLDELVHQENCRTLAAIMSALSEMDQQLLSSLVKGTPKGLSLRELARRTGRSIRALQRRRKTLRDRVRSVMSL